MSQLNQLSDYFENPPDEKLLRELYADFIEMAYAAYVQTEGDASLLWNGDGAGKSWKNWFEGEYPFDQFIQRGEEFNVTTGTAYKMLGINRTKFDYIMRRMLKGGEITSSILRNYLIHSDYIYDKRGISVESNVASLTAGIEIDFYIDKPKLKRELVKLTPVQSRDLESYVPQPKWLVFELVLIYHYYVSPFEREIRSEQYIKFRPDRREQFLTGDDIASNESESVRETPPVWAGFVSDHINNAGDVFFTSKQHYAYHFWKIVTETDAIKTPLRVKPWFTSGAITQRTDDALNAYLYAANEYIGTIKNAGNDAPNIVFDYTSEFALADEVLDKYIVSYKWEGNVATLCDGDTAHPKVIEALDDILSTFDNESKMAAFARYLSKLKMADGNLDISAYELEYYIALVFKGAAQRPRRALSIASDFIPEGDKIAPRTDGVLASDIGERLRHVLLNGIQIRFYYVSNDCDFEEAVDVVDNREILKSEYDFCFLQPNNYYPILPLDFCMNRCLELIMSKGDDGLEEIEEAVSRGKTRSSKPSKTLKISPT